MQAIITTSDFEFIQHSQKYCIEKGVEIELKCGRIVQFSDNASFCMVSCVEDARGRFFESVIALKELPRNFAKVLYVTQSHIRIPEWNNTENLPSALPPT